MSGFGFGFGPAGSGGSSGDGDDLSGKIPLFAELQKLLAGSGGPVNWDLAQQLAISNLAANHASVSPADAAAVSEALRLADLWLDSATDLPSGVSTTQAWSQVAWVENSITTWAALCDPVAGRVVSAMASSLPPELAAQAGPMAPMMSQLGGLMFGAQLGQGLAELAGEVVSATDVGLPLGPAGHAALVPVNVAKFAAEVGQAEADVRLFLAAREVAHQRLFQHVPWLRHQVLEAVDAYGRGISIDPQAVSAALSDLDPSNPESLQRALTNGLFEPVTTDAQTMALKRLETLLALIEGWVDSVVTDAIGTRMQATAPLTEAIRRRRATGGPAEQTFATLVGLELRPRRLHEAVEVWTAMALRHGVTARDGLWNHPDLLPTDADLTDPAGFALRYGADTADQELSGLLTGSGTDSGTAAEPHTAEGPVSAADDTAEDSATAGDGTAGGASAESEDHGSPDSDGATPGH